MTNFKYLTLVQVSVNSSLMSKIVKNSVNMQQVFMILCCRLCCNLGYSGLFLGIDELAGDIFVNNLIAGAVELIAYASAFLIMKTGRKGMYVSLQLTGGVALFAAGFVVTYLPGDCKLSANNSQN